MLHSILNNQALVSSNVVNDQALVNALQNVINREHDEYQQDELIRAGKLPKRSYTVWNISDRD